MFLRTRDYNKDTPGPRLHQSAAETMHYLSALEGLIDGSDPARHTSNYCCISQTTKAGAEAPLTAMRIRPTENSQ